MAMGLETGGQSLTLGPAPLPHSGWVLAGDLHESQNSTGEFIPHHHPDLQGWPNQPMKAKVLSRHLAWPQLKTGLRSVGQGLHECWLWTLWIPGLPPPLTSSENTYTQRCAIWTRLDAWMEFCNEEAEGRAPWGEEQHERQHSGMSIITPRETGDFRVS